MKHYSKYTTSEDIDIRASLGCDKQRNKLASSDQDQRRQDEPSKPMAYDP